MPMHACMHLKCAHAHTQSSGWISALETTSYEPHFSWTSRLCSPTLQVTAINNGKKLRHRSMRMLMSQPKTGSCRSLHCYTILLQGA